MIFFHSEKKKISTVVKKQKNAANPTLCITQKPIRSYSLYQFDLLIQQANYQTMQQTILII